MTAGRAVPRSACRSRLPFDAVNRPGTPDHDPGLQRHHLIPRQLLSQRCFARLFEAVGPGRIGFDDFRANGMLLPSSDAAALRMAMPLHRGPHHRYSGMVIERVGRIEAAWTRRRLTCGHEAAGAQALMQFGLVQRALRRRLLMGGTRRFALNRSDPSARQADDWAELDAMVDLLWADTGAAQRSASLAARSALAS